MDARNVCHKLGIPYYLIDESEAFKQEVIRYFAEEYKAGRTPNPCCVCNEKIKFGALLEHARRLGAQFVATGHFARVEPSADGKRTLLKRGYDPRKDQSYFLFSLRQNQLARCLFPLGEKTKQDTRQLARQHELKTAEKEESMEICFVPDNNYGRFLAETGLVQKQRGQIVNLEGKVLGWHDGIAFYTIGQRKGLGISSPKPLYVIELDAANNRVVVGDDLALDKSEFTVGRCNWIAFETLEREMVVMAKIRYNHPGTPATISPLASGQVRVRLHTPQRAITPGQACVFYLDDVVAGGGWITESPQITEPAA
jgi:tRNA-specific 2-thiouridylase